METSRDGRSHGNGQPGTDSLCCYQCHRAYTILWQGTRARPVATWALRSQAQRAAPCQIMEEKDRRVVKELEEARLQLKTSQAEVITLQEELIALKRRVQELLHFKEELLLTIKTLNELEVLLKTHEEEAQRKAYEHMQEKEAIRQEEVCVTIQKWGERRENSEKKKEQGPNRGHLMGGNCAKVLISSAKGQSWPLIQPSYKVSQLPAVATEPETL
ncbi:hypothetical protein EMCRGX_G010899 [Ephydatia muelleri]